MSHQHNIPTAPHHRHQNSNSGPIQPFGNNAPSPFDEGSMVMQMGLQFGNKIIDEGKGRLSSIETSELRKRFAVTHEFVLGKLKLLAFPFRQQFLRSGTTDGGAGAGAGGSSYNLGGDNIDLLSSTNGGSSNNNVSSCDPASGNVLANDLYLPLMSLITYVVLCAFGTGLTSSAQLSPSGLATTVSVSTALVVFEALAIKLWRMLTSLPPPNFFDTMALFGYFFVNVCYALVARALFDAWLPPLSWALSLYYLGAFGFFMYKSLADSFDKDGSIPKRAVPILYAATLIQAPLFLWFVRRAY